MLSLSSAASPQGVLQQIRSEVASAAPSQAVEFELYPQIVGASLARERLGMMLLVVFGIVALVLAGVGIYGVISYSVTQRTAEIAIRASMGASASQVLQLIMRHGVQLALAGVAAGVVGAVVLRQVVASQLYEMNALDPRVFVFVPITLLLVALLATFFPAQRATKIDPVDLDN